MTTKEAVAAACASVGKTQAEAAKLMGWAPQQLWGRISRGSMRSDEFLKLLDIIGVDFTMTVRETGEPVTGVKSHVAGVGRRVRAMVDRVVYDTDSSDALSNNFYADGVNEYSDGRAMELYVDNEGRYFFAEYSNWKGAKDRITPVPADVAASFMDKYGTKLDKAPKKDDELADEPAEEQNTTE